MRLSTLQLTDGMSTSYAIQLEMIAMLKFAYFQVLQNAAARLGSSSRLWGNFTANLSSELFYLQSGERPVSTVPGVWLPAYHTAVDLDRVPRTRTMEKPTSTSWF